MKTIRAALFLALTAVLIQGCATIVDGKTQSVTFNSEPEGATVTVAGRVMGKTPLTVQIEKDKNLAVSFTKDGYKQYTTQLGTSIDGWFWGNIVIGGLFGSTTDAATGSMYEFSPNQYFATLSPDTPLGISTSKPRQIKEIIINDGMEFRRELTVGGGETTNAILALIGTSKSESTATIKALGNLAAKTPNDLDLAESIISIYEVK